EERTEEATDRRQQQALGDERPRNTSPASAQGGSKGHFALTRFRAHEKEIGDIRSCDQEDKGNASKQEPEWRRNIPGYRVAERFKRHRPAKSIEGLFRELGEALRNSTLQRGDLFSSGGERHARSQPRQ